MSGELVCNESRTAFFSQLGYLPLCSVRGRDGAIALGDMVLRNNTLRSLTVDSYAWTGDSVAHYLTSLRAESATRMRNDAQLVGAQRSRRVRALRVLRNESQRDKVCLPLSVAEPRARSSPR
jgi:hypothetical protein